jgi:hypothetical protein
MQRRYSLSSVLFACALLLLFDTRAGNAREWSSTLEGGGTVTVDPRTRRATVTRDGVQSQLWDGVHELQDGSTITVRSGVVVPTAPMLATEQPSPEDTKLKAWIGAPIVGYSPCERLVRNVCGTSDECATAAGCEPARQLLEMEKQERQANSSPNIMTYSSAQCQEADKDKTLFGTCGQTAEIAGTAPEPEQLDTGMSPCQHLVHKVCGKDDACDGEEACDAARQMVPLEEQDRINSGLKSYQFNPTSNHCRQILLGDAYFKSCLQE